MKIEDLLNQSSDLIKRLDKELKMYQTGYNLLHSKWSHIPDEDKTAIDEKLRKIGL